MFDLAAFTKLRRLNGREIKALFVLSIVVPVGLLAAFRLTGVLKEPVSMKSITVEAVTLTLSRPSETIWITNRSVENKWLEAESFISVHVQFIEYREGPNTPGPYNSHDGLMFAFRVNASLTQGLLDTIKISFHPLDRNGILFISEERWSLHLDNATLMALHYPGTNEADAYIKVNVSNSSCSISDENYWIFLDESGSHELQITVEAVQTSETFARIIAVPIELKITSLGV